VRFVVCQISETLYEENTINHEGSIMAYRTPELQLVGAAQHLVLHDSETGAKIPGGATTECPSSPMDEASADIYDIPASW
jgi:hypothetical protein